jgi:hypothetical protein
MRATVLESGGAGERALIQETGGSTTRARVASLRDTTLRMTFQLRTTCRMNVASRVEPPSNL